MIRSPIARTGTLKPARPAAHKYQVHLSGAVIADLPQALIDPRFCKRHSGIAGSLLAIVFGLTSVILEKRARAHCMSARPENSVRILQRIVSFAGWLDAYIEAAVRGNWEIALDHHESSVCAGILS
jgi:hypothetical protein